MPDRLDRYNSQNPNLLIDESDFNRILECVEKRYLTEFEILCSRKYNVDDKIQMAQRRMSNYASAIRNIKDMSNILVETQKELETIHETVGVSDKSKLFKFFKLKDILISQSAYLTAMIDYSETAGDTRGSSLYYDENGVLREGLDETFRFCEENVVNRKRVQYVFMNGKTFSVKWRNIRPIPNDDSFFENVWRTFRENKNIY